MPVATRIELRDLRPEDWPEVASIYDEGIRSGNATFETDVPSWEHWDASHDPKHRLVAVAADELFGWAALSPVSERCCYEGVAESSVYLSQGWHGRGVGRALLERLIVESEAAGTWTIQARIFPENEASVALHLRCGFRLVGRRERLGRLDGVWRDVLLLEWRSGAVA